MKKFLAAVLTAAMMLSLAACGSSNWPYTDKDVTVTKDGDASTYVGGINSSLRTAWFDFAVTDAYLTDEIAGYEAEDGYDYLVVSVSLRNTFNDSVPMYDGDFMIKWGDGKYENVYCYDGDEHVLEDQFPSEYEIGVKEIKSGTLIFGVPADKEDFSFVFREYYEDGSEGNDYIVNFTADEK